MIGFRIQMNRDRMVTAGLEGHHVVSVIVSSSQHPPSMSSSDQHIGVGGLQVAVDGSQRSVSWLDSPLQVGDAISIEVVEVSEVDTPRPRDPTSLESYERQQLRQLLEKYGEP